MPARSIKVPPIHQRQEGRDREGRFTGEQIHHQAAAVGLDRHPWERLAGERGDEVTPHHVPVVGLRAPRGDRRGRPPLLRSVAEAVRREPADQIVVGPGDGRDEARRDLKASLGARTGNRGERGDRRQPRVVERIAGRARVRAYQPIDVSHRRAAREQIRGDAAHRRVGSFEQRAGAAQSGRVLRGDDPAQGLEGLRHDPAVRLRELRLEPGAVLRRPERLGGDTPPVPVGLGEQRVRSPHARGAVGLGKRDHRLTPQRECRGLHPALERRHTPAPAQHAQRCFCLDGHVHQGIVQ